MWNTVPVGLRNKLDCSKPQKFVVWESLFPDSCYPVPTISHSSKLWPLTKVVHWEKIKLYVGDPDVHLMSGEERDSFALSCAWRYAAAVPDNALRNFLWVRGAEKGKGKVYSVDEDGCFRSSGPSPFRFQKEQRKMLVEHIQNRYTAVLLPVLNRWPDILVGCFIKQANKIIS